MSQSGEKVDKYFGTKLPPVCARLGCYLSDDGQRFYCVNSSCQKHKKRATKHTKTSRAKTEVQVFFRCPRCKSQDIAAHLGTYTCRGCQYEWKPEAVEPES